MSYRDQIQRHRRMVRALAHLEEHGSAACEDLSFFQTLDGSVVFVQIGAAEESRRPWIFSRVDEEPKSEITWSAVLIYDADGMRTELPVCLRMHADGIPHGARSEGGGASELIRYALLQRLDVEFTPAYRESDAATLEDL